MSETTISEEHADALFTLNELHDFFRHLEALGFDLGATHVELSMERRLENLLTIVPRPLG